MKPIKMLILLLIMFISILPMMNCFFNIGMLMELLG